MLRILNYALNLVVVLTFLILILPFALLGANHDIRSALGEAASNNLLSSVPYNLQYFDVAGSVSSMVVLMIFAYVILFVQQHFWFLVTKRTNKFEVPKKWTKAFAKLIVVTAFFIMLAFILAMVAWAVPLGTAQTTKLWQQEYHHREVLYIVFLVITGLIGISIMGVNAWINLQIAYDQQIKIVDEGIKNGTYDPVTRRPYKSVESEVVIGGKNNSSAETKAPTEQSGDDQQATSGFLGA